MNIAFMAVKAAYRLLTRTVTECEKDKVTSFFFSSLNKEPFFGINKDGRYCWNFAITPAKRFCKPVIVD